MPEPPLLIVISGAPATGKTTLARNLGERLGLYVLTKDDVKETMAEPLGVASVENSRRLGGASFDLIFRMTADLLRAGVSLILESNFATGRDESRIGPLARQGRLLQLHCTASGATILRRLNERVGSGERHWSHFDAERLTQEDLSSPEYWNQFTAPLDLGCPTHVLDSSDGFEHLLDSALDFIAGSDSGRQPTSRRELEEAAVPSALLRKIDCVQLAVPDLRTALAFYRDALGQELKWQQADSAGLRLPETGAELVLQTERPEPEVDFLVDSADGAAERFRAAGGHVLKKPFDIPIGRCTVVADPWGNELVLLDLSKGLLVTDSAGNVLTNEDGSPRVRSPG